MEVRAVPAAPAVDVPVTEEVDWPAVNVPLRPVTPVPGVTIARATLFAPLLVKVRLEFTVVPAMALIVLGLVSVNTPLAWLKASIVTGVA